MANKSFPISIPLVGGQCHIIVRLPDSHDRLVVDCNSDIVQYESQSDVPLPPLAPRPNQCNKYDFAKINKLLKKGFLQIGDLLDIGLVSGFENFESKLSPNSTCEEAIRILIRYTRERNKRQVERLLDWIKEQRLELWEEHRPYCCTDQPLPQNPAPEDN